MSLSVASKLDVAAMKHPPNDRIGKLTVKIHYIQAGDEVRPVGRPGSGFL